MQARLLVKIGDRKIVGKGENDKHMYTNYRRVSVSRTFSKIIELFTFDQLTELANKF